MTCSLLGCKATVHDQHVPGTHICVQLVLCSKAHSRTAVSSKQYIMLTIFHTMVKVPALGKCLNSLCGLLQAQECRPQPPVTFGPARSQLNGLLGIM